MLPITQFCQIILHDPIFTRFFFFKMRNETLHLELPPRVALPKLIALPPFSQVTTVTIWGLSLATCFYTFPIHNYINNM